MLLTFLFACTASENVTKVIFHTTEGNIEVELYPDKAPLTVANFMQYVDDHNYDCSQFYRTVRPDNQPNNAVKIEVIQGGLEFSDSALERPPIHHESTMQTGIRHIDGTISMARLDTGTVTSEFFICIGDQPALDYGGNRNPDLQGFSAFGKVTSGMEVVLAIQAMPDANQLLLKPVVIDSIRRIK